MIGDTMAPLLRIVNVLRDLDEPCENDYVSIQFHKLLTKQINEIRIEIRTEDGTLVPFEYGTVKLTLEFKKMSYF
jgi:hypothetical protein